MRDRHRYVNVRPYLPHALLATLGVMGLPFLAVIGLLRVADPDPGFFALLLFGLAVGIAAGGLGIALWRTRPESADIAFGELLIWGWLQRKRADDRLDEGAALLGLDRSGHPTRSVRISPEDQLAVLKDLTEALEAKDPYTHGHSQRVERHSYRTAAAMGLSVDSIEELRLAAALHDVGKIRIPDRVLRKPGRLTREERSIIEDHVVVGAWMVSSVGSADVVSSVRHHHERWDGRGYPDGLAGTDIPLFARIIAVSDAYDAITSTRPYRVKAGREHAVNVLREDAGSQFDPMIVSAFVNALPIRLPVAGALVLFSGPAAFGRKIAMWLKRVGAGHVAPAAATLGAIVTLGSFMQAPATLKPPAPVIAQQESVERVGSSTSHGADAPRAGKSNKKVSRSAPNKILVADAGGSRRQDVVLPRRIVSTDPATGSDVDESSHPRSGPVARPLKPRPHPEPDPSDDPSSEPASEPEARPTPVEEEDDHEDEGDDDSCSEDGSHGNGYGHDKGRGEGHDHHDDDSEDCD